MSTPLLTRRRVIAAKIETTEGVGEAITAADAGLLVADVKFDIDFKQNERNVVLDTLSNLSPTIGTRSVSITFKAELKGAGAIYTPLVKPAIGIYLQACGMAETLDTTDPAAPIVDYLPASYGIPSLTIWVYEDGLVKKAAGCRGTFKISGKVGECVFADFTFTGVYVSTSDLPIISPSFEASMPPVLMGTAITTNLSPNETSFAPVAESFGFDIGNSVNLRSSISAVNGFTNAMITSRKPTGTINPEATLIATNDAITTWKNAKGFYIQIAAPPTPGFEFTSFAFLAQHCVLTKITSSDRNGIMVSDMAFNMAMGNGDDEFKITFTK